MINGWRYRLDPIGRGEGYRLQFAPTRDGVKTEEWDTVAQSLDRMYLNEVADKELRERMNKVFAAHATS